MAADMADGAWLTHTTASGMCTINDPNHTLAHIRSRYRRRYPKRNKCMPVQRDLSNL